MINVNSVTILGGLTKDIEVRYSQNGIAMGNFSLGFTTYSKGANEKNEKSNYIDVSLFGKQVDNLKQYLVKGAKIAVSGRLEQQTWQDSQSGQQRSKIVIIADSIQLLGGNSQQNSQPQQYQQNGYAPNPQYQQQQNFQQMPQQPNGFQMPNGVQQGFGQNMSEFPDQVPF